MLQPKTQEFDNTNRVNPFFGLTQMTIRALDSLVNGKDIGIFERIITQIMSENRLIHYDQSESYYNKIHTLQEQRRENEDITDTKLISDGGMIYTVKSYTDITFTRGELEKIGDLYTRLQIPELF